MTPLLARIDEIDAEIIKLNVKVESAEASGEIDLLKLYLSAQVELRKEKNHLLGAQQQPGEYDSV